MESLKDKSYNNEKTWKVLKNLLDKGYDYITIKEILDISPRKIKLLMNSHNYDYKCMTRIHYGFKFKTKYIDVENLMNEGLTYREIGDRLNISYQRVHQIAKEHGLDHLHHRGYKIAAKITPEVNDKIISLLKSGKRIKEISDELNIPITMLREYFKLNNVDYLNISKQALYDRIFKDIKYLFGEGKTYAETAAILGVSRAFVIKICKLNNYKKYM